MTITLNVANLKKASKNPASSTKISLAPSAEKLCQQHFEEWSDSGVSPEIIKLNVKSIAGQQIIDHLKLNSLPDYRLRNYASVLKGGWACGTHFKPDTPRLDYKRKRPIKYEKALGTPSEPVLLKLPEETWQAIAQK